MKTFAAPLVFFTFSALCYANSPSPATPQTTAETAVESVAYYLPSSISPQLEAGSQLEAHLELRQAAAAGAAQPQPVPGAAAGAAQPQPVPAVVAGAAQPQPVAGAAPAVGVGGAGAVPAAAQPASVNPDQVSPVTVAQVFSVIGGVTKQVPFTYTQKFSSIPNQGPTPAKGVIGLGTLTGKVGVINTAEAKKGSASQAGVGLGVILASVLGMLAVWA